jgi:pimeloyl-ACP methyl ester carboxylesterase
MQTCSISSSTLSYRLSGSSSKPLVIIETALGACCAEWWHLIEKWSNDFYILTYERAGYGESSNSSLPRSPINIARELKELLDVLALTQPAILIGHSMGGLYVQQFARLYPKNVRAIILLDPVSAKNYTFRQSMSKSEYTQSGFDKQINFKIGLTVTNLHLGFLFKPLFKQGIPFPYLKDLPKEIENYILRHLTHAKLYRNALAEYAYIDFEQQLSTLEEKGDFPPVPLHLICHSPEIMIEEIERYGGAEHEVAVKLNQMWVDVMKEYLKFSPKSTYHQSIQGNHYIHLTDPEIIWQTLKSLS